METINSEDILNFNKMSGLEPWVINAEDLKIEWYRGTGGLLYLQMEFKTKEDFENLEIIEMVEELKGREVLIGVKQEV